MKTAKKISATIIFMIVLASLPFSSLAQSVSIDASQMQCTWYEAFSGQYSLFPNVPITFPIRYTNNTDNFEAGISNGFLIYMDSDHNGSPDPGGSFGPVSASVTEEYPFDGGYFDFFEPEYIDNDGLGTDLIGFLGVAAFLGGSGLPAGFDDIAAYITVGPLPEGGRICIDSSFFPLTGTWKWAPSGVIPQWNGPYCYDIVMPPCLWNDFYNTPDTLRITTCGTYEYQFQEVSCASYNYQILEGPGSMTNDALYTYQYDPVDNGTVQSVRIFADESSGCIIDQWTIDIPIKIDIPLTEFRTPGDVNTDCISDIEDLVFFVDYQFRGGEAPAVFELADCNADGIVDIEDLVYLVDYQFHDGPEPIVPW